MSDPAYKRVLLKLSGEALMGEKQYGIDPAVTAQIAKDVKDIQQLGVETAIVIGGGNIFRGLAASARGMDRATGDYMGMLATVINALALQDALEQMGVLTRVMSAIEMRAVAEPFIRRRVDGIYSADPLKDSSATRYETISYLEALEKRLQVMDATAISLCMDNQLPILVFNLRTPGNLRRAVLGEPVGSVVKG